MPLRETVVGRNDNPFRFCVFQDGGKHLVMMAVLCQYVRIFPGNRLAEFVSVDIPDFGAGHSGKHGGKNAEMKSPGGLAVKVMRAGVCFTQHHGNVMMKQT